jgi:hypothetical protein
MPVPALRHDFVDQHPPEPEDLPAAEYNLNAERTDEAHDLATAASAALDDKAALVHTHTAANITDFTEAAQDAIAAMLAQGTGVTLTYNDAANSLTIAATGDIDAEAVRDAIGIAMIGAGNISVVVNDAADTITISTTATVNSTDAALRDRSTHTGTQPTSSVTGLDTALGNKVDKTASPSRVYGTDGVGAQATFGISSAATASTIPTRSAGGVVSVGTPTLAEHAGTKAYIDSGDTAAKDRANHTGTQTSATISDFSEAAQDAVATMLTQGTGVTLSYNDAANTLTITGTLGDPETIRDVMGIAMVGAGLITVTINDAADTLTISTTATANSTDAALRDRGTHTGTQTASTISDLTEVVQDIAGALLADGTGIDVIYNDAGNIVTINIANITTAMLSPGTLVTEAEGIAANDNDTTIPTSAAVKDAIDDAVGGASQIGVWGGYLGDGSPAGTDYTFNHGLNSRHVEPVYRDKVTGQKIIVDDYVTGLNTVRVEPDALWALNRITVTVFAHLGMDVTAPTAPTVNLVSKTTTTIDVSATGSTDAVGVVWYRWWLDGVLVGEGAVNTFQFTGLSGSIEYDCGCTTVDLAGNESNLGVTPITTNAPANVAFESTGTAQVSSTNGAQIVIPHTVANVPNRWLLALVAASNVSEAWGGESVVDTKTLTSQLDGALSLLGAINVGISGQWTGNMWLFGKQMPTVGAHNLTSNIEDASVDHVLTGQSFLYSGVGSLDTVVEYEPNAAGNLAVAVPNVAVGDMAFGAGVFYNAQATAFNQTLRAAIGSARTGGADFITAGDAAGAGGTINFTATSPNHRAGFGVRLIKAA